MSKNLEGMTDEELRDKLATLREKYRAFGGSLPADLKPVDSLSTEDLIAEIQEIEKALGSETSEHS